MPKGPQPPEGLPPGVYITLSGGAWSNAASFHVRGSELDPDVVTRAVGIEPSRASKRGEPIALGSDRAHRRGGWSLDSDVLSVEDDHLDEHLRWLLDRLEPRARQLRDVVTERALEAEFWCVVHMDAANVDFELRPETLARVAAPGAALRLDIYAPDDAQPEVIEIAETGGEAERPSTD